MFAVIREFLCRLAAFTQVNSRVFVPVPPALVLGKTLREGKLNMTPAQCAHISGFKSEQAVPFLVYLGADLPQSQKSGTRQACTRVFNTVPMCAMT